MKDGYNCLRLEVKNPKDIAEKVRKLPDSPDLQSEIAAMALQSVSELMNGWQQTHSKQVAEKLRDVVMSRSQGHGYTS